MQNVEFKDGKLKAVAQTGVDADKDGVKSVIVNVEIEIDAVEAITEIAKKDLPWLAALVKTLGG